MADQQGECNVKVNADTDPLKAQLAEMLKAGQEFTKSMMTAFDGLTVRGRGFDGVLKSLGHSLKTLGQKLSQIALSAAFKPLEDGINSLFKDVVGGFLGVPKAKTAGAGAAVKPVPFAAGGVVASPAYFPLAGGRSGVIGEAGAEAIMPLRRGSDGRLGVAAAGGGGVAITFNVSAPDADSFTRSETQVAAMLARAVSRGQRVL